MHAVPSACTLIAYQPLIFWIKYKSLPPNCRGLVSSSPVGSTEAVLWAWFVIGNATALAPLSTGLFSLSVKPQLGGVWSSPSTDSVGVLDTYFVVGIWNVQRPPAQDLDSAPASGSRGSFWLFLGQQLTFLTPWKSWTPSKGLCRPVRHCWHPFYPQETRNLVNAFHGVCTSLGNSKASSRVGSPLISTAVPQGRQGRAGPSQTRKLSERQRAQSVSSGVGTASPTPSLVFFHSTWREVYPGWLFRPSQYCGILECSSSTF